MALPGTAVVSALRGARMGPQTRLAFNETSAAPVLRH
jgi:hypothetical protein